MTFNSAQVHNSLWEDCNPHPLPPTPRPPKRSLQKVRNLLGDRTFLCSIDKDAGEEDDIRGTIAGKEVAVIVGTHYQAPAAAPPQPPHHLVSTISPRGVIRRQPSRPSPRVNNFYVATPRPLPSGKTEDEALNAHFKPMYNGSTSSHPLPNRHRGKQKVNARWAQASDEVKMNFNEEEKDGTKRRDVIVDIHGFVQNGGASQTVAGKNLSQKINKKKANEVRFNSHLRNVAMFSCRNRAPLRPTSTLDDRGDKVTLVLPRNLAHPASERLIDKHYPNYRVFLNEGPHALLDPKPSLPPIPVSAPQPRRRIMSADVKRRIQELSDKFNA